jgi:hypothetical protein
MSFSNGNYIRRGCLASDMIGVIARAIAGEEVEVTWFRSIEGWETFTVRKNGRSILLKGLVCGSIKSFSVGDVEYTCEWPVGEEDCLAEVEGCEDPKGAAKAVRQAMAALLGRSRGTPFARTVLLASSGRALTSNEDARARTFLVDLRVAKGDPAWAKLSPNELGHLLADEYADNIPLMVQALCPVRISDFPVSLRAGIRDEVQKVKSLAEAMTLVESLRDRVPEVVAEADAMFEDIEVKDTVATLVLPARATITDAVAAVLADNSKFIYLPASDDFQEEDQLPPLPVALKERILALHARSPREPLTRRLGWGLVRDVLLPRVKPSPAAASKPAARKPRGPQRDQRRGSLGAALREPRGDTAIEGLLKIDATKVTAALKQLRANPDLLEDFTTAPDASSLEAVMGSLAEGVTAKAVALLASSR